MKLHLKSPVAGLTLCGEKILRPDQPSLRLSLDGSWEPERGCKRCLHFLEIKAVAEPQVFAPAKSETWPIGHGVQVSRRRCMRCGWFTAAEWLSNHQAHNWIVAKPGMCLFNPKSGKLGSKDYGLRLVRIIAVAADDFHGAEIVVYVKEFLKGATLAKERNRVVDMEMFMAMYGSWEQRTDTGQW